MQLHDCGSFKVYTSVLFSLIYLIVSNQSLAAEDQLSEEEVSDVFELSMEDLSEALITVASSFTESELTSSSSVSILTPELWEARGDRSTSDALNHTTGAVSYPTLWGGTAYQARGYANNLSVRGSATIVDGVPMNSMQTGTTEATNQTIYSWVFSTKLRSFAAQVQPYTVRTLSIAWLLTKHFPHKNLSPSYQ